MINAKKLPMEPEFPPKPQGKLKMPEEKKEPVVQPPALKSTVIVPKVEEKVNVPQNQGAPEKAKPVVPVAAVEPPKPVAAPVAPKPVASVPAPVAKPEAAPKPKLTEEQLKGMTKAELKELSKGLGADARSRAKMIAKILESQGK